MKPGDLVIWRTNCIYMPNQDMIYSKELVIITHLWNPEGYSWWFCDVMKSSGEMVSGVHICELELLDD